MTWLYYLLLFVGLTVFGDMIMVPAVYLSLSGPLDLGAVVILVLVSDIGSDAVWYWIGKRTTKEKVFSMKIAHRNKAWLSKISNGFEKKGLRVLAYSKFIYGARIVVRILCGTYRLPFGRYMLINSMTTVIWVGIIAGVAFFFKSSLGSLKIALRHTEISLGIFIIVVAFIDLWLKDKLKDLINKRFSDSHNSKNSDAASN